LTKINKTYL